MTIDSSALVAILCHEPERERLIRSMAAAPRRLLSAASFLEAGVVLNRLLGERGLAMLNDFVETAGIQVVPMSPAHADLALSAYRRFGKGMGHPAQLNILDCCAYALAVESREELLFKGNDFGKTNILVAMY